MNGSRRLFVCIFLLGVLCPAASGGSAEMLEIQAGPAGPHAVRSLTPADGLPTWPVPASTPPPPPAAEMRDAYLWLDQNHMNAIAGNIAITGDGTYAIVGWWLNNERTSLYRTAEDQLPEWAKSMPQADFQISVAADDVGQRLTSTARNLPLYVLEAGSPIEIFAHAYSPPIVGYHSAVADAGNAYLGAGGLPSGGSGETRAFDGSGNPLFVGTFDDPPMGAGISADGLVAATNVRTYVKVWNTPTGALRDSLPIPGDTQAAAVLSGDGSFLVTGGFSRTVRLYEWDGNQYNQVWMYAIPATTWIRCLAISEDGRTIAAGTWTNPTGGKVVLFDRASAVPLWTDDTYGDSVEDLALTPDGAFLAAASWGRQGGTAGNIISLYERGSAIPTHGILDDSFPYVGSCMAVDLSENGQYLVAGGKAVHAREMGHGGWVMAIELCDPAAIAAASPAGGAVLQAAPNPFVHAARITPTAAGGAPRGALRILDAAGRAVRILEPGASADCWTWNGCDARGRRVPPGVYFANPMHGTGLRLLHLR